MSKRSYRRLAVVAGAALALGSMAPATAARVVDANAVGDADVSVDTIDVSSLLGGAQSNLATTGVMTSVSNVQSLATTTAFTAVNDVRNIAGGAIFGAQCLVGAGTNAVLGLGVSALANGGVGVGVGLGGVGLDLGLEALVAAPLTLLGTASGCVAPLQTAATGAATNLQTAATGAVGLATGTALTTVSSAPLLVSGVMNTASPLLLEELLRIGVSGGGSASAGSGLAGLVNFL